MAPALPKKIAGLRCLGDRFWLAMAMTTALSPERMTLAMMIFHSAAQNAAVDRSGITKSIQVPPLPRGTIAGAFRSPQRVLSEGPNGEDRMPIAARYNKMFPVSWTDLHPDAPPLPSPPS